MLFRETIKEVAAIVDFQTKMQFYDDGSLSELNEEDVAKVKGFVPVAVDVHFHYKTREGNEDIYDMTFFRENNVLHESWLPYPSDEFSEEIKSAEEHIFKVLEEENIIPKRITVTVYATVDASMYFDEEYHDIDYQNGYITIDEKEFAIC